jgi:predicted small integral membrane protein
MMMERGLKIVMTAGLRCGRALARPANTKARAFQHANRFVYAGAGCAILIWFVGFTAVGGEWFAMWQSQIWNGQQAAFRTFASILLVSIFIAQPDCEL